MFDILIRNGTLHDGTGGPPRRADVAIRDGVTCAVGELDGPAERVIDARGCIVTPGFIDPHTHYDGQAIWSSRLSPSSSHGVTTVVAGNCGVGFAPCRPEDRDLLVRTMEGVEDIPGVVMAEGLTWDWQSFPEFLDAIARRPHDIDVAMFVPHVPLRVFVMGQRAGRLEPANRDDIAQMAELAGEAVAAGAIGFSTSRLDSHRDSAGKHIPAHSAEAAELLGIMRGARRSGKVLFQLVPEVLHPNEDAADAEIGMMGEISREADCEVTFTLAQTTGAPQRWRRTLNLVRAANDRGDAVIRPQVFPRPVGMLFGLSATLHPFVLCPGYEALAKLPLNQRVVEMRKPTVRHRLLATKSRDPTVPLQRFTRMFDRIFPFDGSNYEPSPQSSTAAIAAAELRSPEEVAYDLLLQDEGKALLIATIANYSDGNLNAVFEMLSHRDTVVGLGDGGAHYGMICDASYPTYLLSYWTRDRNGEKLALTDAVRMLTSEPAALLGLLDRGRIAPGFRADINVIDYSALRLLPPHIIQDLPSGGHRLAQDAHGYRFTIVRGQVIAEDGRPTGELPGTLIRGRQPTPAAAV